jgi:hypothetical protein
MALNARKVPMGGGKKGPQQEPIEPGTYPCRVVQIIDLGVQPQRDYQGEAKAPVHEIMLTYEFLDEFCLDEDGNPDEEKPRWLSETFPLRNLESDLAKSTKRYYALDPNEDFGGDFTQLVNIPCMVTVVQNAGKGKNAGKVYTNVQGVSSMRSKEAARAPELVNEPKVFVLDEPDLTIFKSLPEWLQDKIKGNLNFEGSTLQEALEDAPEDEEEKPKGKAAPAKKAAQKAAKKPVEVDEEEEAGDEDEPW